MECGILVPLNAFMGALQFMDLKMSDFTKENFHT